MSGGGHSIPGRAFSPPTVPFPDTQQGLSTSLLSPIEKCKKIPGDWVSESKAQQVEVKSGACR